jgi:parallel beta-helix repeat protein
VISKVGDDGIDCYQSSPLIYNNNISYCGMYYGSGIDCRDNSNPTITKNIVSNCISGVGIGIYDSSPLIKENIISNNNHFYGGHYSTGGGIYCSNSSAIIIKNIINNNTASGGGGIFCNSSSAYIALNKICNNYSAETGCGVTDGGGGIFTLSSSPKIINNIICNNSSIGQGGGIYLNDYDTLSATPILIVNNTIANNSANTGGGIYTRYDSNPTIVNTIIWGNSATTAGDGVFIENTISTFLYCDVDTIYKWFPVPDTIINCIKSIPKFVNPSAGTGLSYDGLAADWNIQPSSPCINAGNPDTTGLFLCNIDIAGENRILEDTIDIGAFEYNKFSSVPEIANHSEMEILIFPNPAFDHLTLKFAQNTSKAEIKIYNLLGELKSTSRKSSTESTIDISDLANGVYIIEVTTERNIMRQKFIKQ